MSFAISFQAQPVISTTHMSRMDVTFCCICISVHTHLSLVYPHNRTPSFALCYVCTCMNPPVLTWRKRPPMESLRKEMYVRDTERKG